MGHPAPDRYKALGFRFIVEVDDPTLGPWFRDAFGALREDDPDGPAPEVVRFTARDHGWRVTVGDTQVCDRTPPPQVLSRLLVHLNRRIAESAAGTHLMLHAGVVGASAGVVVLPAPSGSGKSTLVASAVRSGRWSYGGDEHAALDLDDGRVHPVPKPIALKSGAAPLFAEHEPGADALAPYMQHQLVLPASQLGGDALAAPTTPILVAFPRYDPDASGVTVDHIDPADALMALRENAFNFTTAPRRSFAALATLVRRVRALRVTYEDAESALSVLHDYVP